MAELEELKIGDDIDIGQGFVTELKKITYCKIAELTLYWFVNERGEYKYNIREAIKKVKKTGKSVLEIDYYKILEDAYKEHKSLVVAFDFDNTVYDYHKKGIDFEPIVDLLKRCDNLGFQLICFTSNGGRRLVFIEYYIKEVLQIFGIKNKVLINKTTTFDKTEATEFHTKPYANIYLDDKAGLAESYYRLLKLVENIESNKI